MPKNKESKIVYEDSELIVVEKPAGLVVHPGAGREQKTLVSWLEAKYPEIKKYNWPNPQRPGIIHRLDQDTSGLMVLAKNPEALEKIQGLFQSQAVSKSYMALVYGKMDKAEGEIKSFVGRDPHAKRQQISRSIFFDFEPGAKREAITKYRCIKEYKYQDEILTLVEATLKTGRTHQIRVQFKSLGHPVIGDQTYNTKPSRRISKELNLNRQFLHAYKLSFEGHDFESKLPDVLQSILNKLSVIS